MALRKMSPRGIDVRIETAEMALLSLERAKRIVPKDYLPAYDWLQLHEDADPMRRPTKASGLADDLPIKLVAGMRGIHKPAGYDYALTVTSSGNGFYKDGVIDQGDGTWILNYSAQEKNLGSEKMDPVYNEALRKCLVDGVPVGVFVKVSNAPALYKCKGLAFVESYEDGIFTLHGPVRDGQSAEFWSIIAGEDFSPEGRRLLQELDEKDERVFRAVIQAQRVRQDKFRANLLEAYGGRCAISSCDVEPALQAAHISSYRGPKSQLTSNGLLLRADLHLLYDSYLLSVDPDGYRVRLAPQVRQSRYHEIDGGRLRLPYDSSDSPSVSRLAAHYSKFVMHHALNP